MDTMEILASRVMQLKGKQHQKVLAEKIGMSSTSLSEKLRNIKKFSIYDLAMLSKYFEVSTDWLLGLTDSDPDTEIDSLSLRDLARILARLWKLSYIDVFEDMGENEEPRGLCIYFPYPSRDIPEVRCESDLTRKMKQEDEEREDLQIDVDAYTMARAHNNRVLGQFMITITKALDALVDNPAVDGVMMEHIINGELKSVPKCKMDYLKNDVLDTLLNVIPERLNRTLGKKRKRS